VESFKYSFVYLHTYIKLRSGVLLVPVLTRHDPAYSFPCKECEHLSQNHKGEGYDFCTLLEIWIDPKLSKKITCNARKRKWKKNIGKKEVSEG